MCALHRTGAVGAGARVPLAVGSFRNARASLTYLFLLVLRPRSGERETGSEGRQIVLT